MVAAINATLKDEMARDPRIVVFGEDVADASREEALATVTGKGGVFKVTHGLQRQFGSDRVFNSPLAEANIIGRGVGMALRGLKPVVEIQFFDYIWPGVHADPRRDVDDALPLGQHLVVPDGHPRADRRLPARRRARITASRAISIFAHTPASASSSRRTPRTRRACCARRSAATIRCCSSSTSISTARPTTRASIPGPDYTIPFGKAAVARDGSDVVVFTWGALVQRSLLAAQQAERTASASPSSTCARSSLRLGHDRRLHAEDQPRRDRARRPADVRLRSRDRRAHLAKNCSNTSTRQSSAWPRLIVRWPTRRCSRRSILPGSADVLKAIRTLAAY